MQDKELEKILQEKADKTEMRDFSLVWEEIKGEITPKQKEKKPFWKKKFFLIFAPTLLAVCIAFSPLINKLFNPIEEVFYSDELGMESVTAKEVIDGLSGASIFCDNLSKYTIIEPYLYYNEAMDVKGSRMEFYNENPTTMFAKMKLYASNVELNLDVESLYNTHCQVNSADVYYKFISSDSGFYEYSVYATYNGVKYLIEYSGISDNLMEFLADFFA